MSKRATAAEAEYRQEVVYEKLTFCWTPADIARFASTEWDITERQAYVYINRAWEQLKSDGKAHREQALDRQLSHYRAIIKEQSKPGGSVRLVLEALKSERDLLGLQIAPKKQMPILEALEILVSQGLATPIQLQVVHDGILEITNQIRAATQTAILKPADGDSDRPAADTL